MIRKYSYCRKDYTIQAKWKYNPDEILKRLGEGSKLLEIWQRLLWMVLFAFFLACICSNVYDFSTEWKLFQIDCNLTLSLLFMSLHHNFNFKTYAKIHAHFFQKTIWTNKECKVIILDQSKIVLDQQKDWAHTYQLITSS